MEDVQGEVEEEEQTKLVEKSWEEREIFGTGVGVESGRREESEMRWFCIIAKIGQEASWEEKRKKKEL